MNSTEQKYNRVAPKLLCFCNPKSTNSKKQQQHLLSSDHKHIIYCTHALITKFAMSIFNKIRLVQHLICCLYCFLLNTGFSFCYTYSSSQIFGNGVVPLCSFSCSPDGPRFTSITVFPVGEVSEGSSVTLTCSSDAAPPVESFAWFKGTGLTSVHCI